jgi:F1F0 ATPase subunit 2
MIEMLILSLIAGATLGTIFFMGLWWTVRKGLNANNPAIWFLLSFLLRMLLAIVCFYWIAQLGEWQNLAIALLGFVASRMILTRYFSKNKITSSTSFDHSVSLTKESNNAP